MKSKNVLTSFKYAIKGIGSALKTERNLKIHFSITVLIIIGGFALNISAIEWVTCFLIIGLVIGSELINTAIEEVVNLVSPEINPIAGKAKDIAAGAVFFIAIIAIIVGAIIFGPKIAALF